MEKSSFEHTHAAIAQFNILIAFSPKTNTSTTGSAAQDPSSSRNRFLGDIQRIICLHILLAVDPLCTTYVLSLFRENENRRKNPVFSADQGRKREHEIKCFGAQSKSNSLVCQLQFSSLCDLLLQSKPLVSGKEDYPA